ncbi:MAG TPA: DUF6081 family protein [Chloroflexia bacterium]|nr:DUF6081 family protein [Chloroflexia bacterium]
MKRIRLTSFATLALVMASLAAFSLSPVSAAAKNSKPRLPVYDNFREGFMVGTPTAKWFYFAAPGSDGSTFTGDDGLTFTGPFGLVVIPKGHNPRTGLPAFTKTVSQTDPYPGAFDHVKWLVYANHTASSGFPGFDALPGKELVCQSTIAGQTFGTREQPFGNYVMNPYDDLRLAAVAMPAIDFGTFSVFDTWLTDKHIYAFYEHLPFQRASLGGRYDEYAAFSSAIPIADRTPGQADTVAFAYDKSKGIARWLVNGVEKYRVSAIGFLPPREQMLIDHGGKPESFSPNQLDCGLGLFTLLDGYGPGQRGLVRLNNPAGPPAYLNPLTGQAPARFVDEQSLAKNRLWGQGAALEVSSISIGYWPNH